MPDVLINGAPGDRVAVDDRGLNYGDGLFETMALVDGNVRLLDHHLERLEDGCQRMGIVTPGQQELLADIDSVAAQQEHAVIKIVVTRGSGPRGYRLPDPASPTRIVSVSPWPEHISDLVENGAHIRVCETRIGTNPRLAGIKHLNRLEQVMARMEWKNPDIYEGLMLDAAGHIVCGTMTNVFALVSGRLVTPALDLCGVTGVMRRFVLDQAQQIEIETRVERLTLDVLDRCDELLLTNSIIGICPVTMIGMRSLERGPVTQSLIDSLNAVGGNSCDD